MTVQCQRTRMYIVADDERTLVCPHCPDGEVYLKLGAADWPAVLIAGALAVCREEFGRSDDGVPTAVWLGESPETVFERNNGAYHIYLARDSDPWQVMYSGAHEAFHRVFTPPRVYRRTN